MKLLSYIYKLRVILVTLLCISSATLVFGQRYSFHNLNVDDGLIQSQAICLTQDKIGNLWIGTMGGLSRYDGKTFTNYNVRNGLLTNTVYAVAADNSNNIWIGTQKGLSRYNGKTFEHFSLQRQVDHPFNNTQQINIVKDTVWWKAAGDVYYVANGKIKYFLTPGGEGQVSAMLAEPGSLWVAKGDTMFHFVNDHWDTLSFALPGDQKAPNISRIFKDRNDALWLGTTAGLYNVTGKKITPYHLNDQPLNYLSIRSLAQDKTGAFWLGTSNGVMKLSGNTLQGYNKKNGLSDNSFFDVLTDAEGNIWMASDGQGIFRFSGTLFTTVDETLGLPSAQIMAIASNKRDSLFLGTYEAGLFVFNNGKVSPRQLPGTDIPAITSLYYAHNQKLWVGTKEKGLYEYDHETFRQYSAPQHNFPSSVITHVYEDPQNRLWVGFINGVLMYENDTFKTLGGKTNIHLVSCISIGADSLLIATDKSGLLLCNGGVISEFVTHTIVDSSLINCFALRGKELWLGSSDNGAIRYNLLTNSTLVVNKANGLRSDFIYNIIDDSDGNIWVGTGFGIHKIVLGGNNSTQVTFYGKAQGITGMESNINAVLKLKDGTIWFGTTNGAVHYQPHSAVVSSAPASIVMQSVKLAGESTIDPGYYDSLDQWYGIPQNLRLPFKKNNITFSFQAITLSGAEQVLYRYRMEGIDAPWSEWSATNTVTYSALPPGKYIFYVQCLGAGGSVNPQLTYSFEIITPYHKTWWFRVAILFACILIGIFLQSIYNKRNQRRQKLMAKLRAEEQSKIRMRTAEDFHDEIGNKLTRINVLTNVLKSKVTPTPDVTRILDQIEENTSLLYGGTRDILWSLKPSNDNLYEILVRIHDFGGELFQDTNVQFTVTGIEEKWRNNRLPMDMSRNLLMIFKEALNNALKYSKAQNITLEVSMKRRDVLQMILKDDGLGFDLKAVKKGNGVNNMSVRAGRLGGRLYIDSYYGKGTIISLTFRVPKMPK